MTRDTLVLDSQPWSVSIIMVAAILCVAGTGLMLIGGGVILPGTLLLGLGCPVLFLFLLTLARRNQLVLDRRANELRHRRRTLLGYGERVLPLDRLERAIVQDLPDTEGRSCRLAYVLRPGAEQGPWLFTWAFSSGPPVRRAADLINDWLRGGVAPSAARVDSVGPSG
ncbi:hypothetical protein [Histidinibacterium lentulum]|nr:hypothetical protein [Histidinibacterium lentulum]